MCVGKAMLKLSAALGVLVLFAACREKPAPPPIKMCTMVFHGSDEVSSSAPCANKDSDGDEIDDAVDRCPEHKEVMNGVYDRDGCPDPDQDKDLIVDTEDACPKVAGTPPDGCVFKDSDGDGLADHLDACPQKAEDLDLIEDDDGCPEGEELNLGESPEAEMPDDAP